MLPHIDDGRRGALLARVEPKSNGKVMIEWVFFCAIGFVFRHAFCVHTETDD